MTQRDSIEPTYDAPFSVAVDDLTPFDFIAIKTHFKLPYEKLSGAERVMGVTWVLMNRIEKTSWDSIGQTPMHELQAWYQPEPSKKDVEAGKGNEPTDSEN